MKNLPHNCEQNIESNMTPAHCKICGKYDETARTVRHYTGEQINRLKEILEIDCFGDSWFSDAESLLKEINKDKK